MKPERTKEEKYTFYKSNRDGEADVFYNGHALPNLPYHVAEELCTAANNHYKLLQRIKELESQTPVESKWVSVKERLPEVPKVLVAHSYGVSEAAYFDGEFFDSRFNHPLPGITHWQPLPELPPIEETKEK